MTAVASHFVGRSAVVACHQHATQQRTPSRLNRSARFRNGELLRRPWTPAPLRRDSLRGQRGRGCCVTCEAALPCEPGKTTLGFVGMGIMGVPMALNLVKAGYEVVVWNRSPGKCDPLKQAGATVVSSATEVAKRSDVVFGMLSDPFAAYSVACRPGGLAAGLTEGKGYVDVSTVDPFTAIQISQGIRATGAQFIEAPVSGSKGPAEAGQLIFLSGGDKELFDRVQHPLQVMGKASFFLGEVGFGANMKLVINSMMGTMMAALSEGMTLAERTGLSKSDLLEIISLGAISSPMFSLKGPAMAAGDFPVAFPLKHQTKDLRFAQELSNLLEIDLPVSNATLSAYERAERLGLGEEDFSALLKSVQIEERQVMMDPRDYRDDDDFEFGT